MKFDGTLIWNRENGRVVLLCVTLGSISCVLLTNSHSFQGSVKFRWRDLLAGINHLILIYNNSRDILTCV